MESPSHGTEQVWQWLVKALFAAFLDTYIYTHKVERCLHLYPVLQIDYADLHLWAHNLDGGKGLVPVCQTSKVTMH